MTPRYLKNTAKVSYTILFGTFLGVFALSTAGYFGKAHGATAAGTYEGIRGVDKGQPGVGAHGSLADRQKAARE